MTRVKRGSVARNRRKKVLNGMRGARGAHSVLFRVATQQRTKALKYAYIDRKCRKRNMRQQWVIRLNALAHLYGFTYSELIHRLRSNNLVINRKVMAQLAIHHRDDMTSLMNQLKD